MSYCWLLVLQFVAFAATSDNNNLCMFSTDVTGFCFLFWHLQLATCTIAVPPNANMAGHNKTTPSYG